MEFELKWAHAQVDLLLSCNYVRELGAHEDTCLPQLEYGAELLRVRCILLRFKWFYIAPFHTNSKHVQVEILILHARSTRLSPPIFIAIP